MDRTVIVNFPPAEEPPGVGGEAAARLAALARRFSDRLVEHSIAAAGADEERWERLLVAQQENLHALRALSERLRHDRGRAVRLPIPDPGDRLAA